MCAVCGASRLARDLIKAVCTGDTRGAGGRRGKKMVEISHFRERKNPV